MALKLRVVSEHRRQLGPRSSMVFGVAGGTIGRGADNDWVLPDPQRYLSGRHARIAFREGNWFLEDTSTNGVFINDASTPLLRDQPHALRDGDLLRLGEYHIIASIDSTQQSAALEPSAIFAVERVNGTGNNSRSPDLGASLNLQALLTVDTSLSDSFRPVNAFGQAVNVSFGRPQVDEEHEPSEDSIARRMARLARAAAARERERERSSPAALYDVATGLQVFCRGAGIDPAALPADAQTRLLHLAGQLCREVLLGLKDLGRARRDLQNRFRIDAAQDVEDTRLSLQHGGVEELLIRLLAGHEVRQADAVQWLRDEFARGKAHQTALAQAMRAAFVDFVGRLAPSELENRFQRAAPSSKAGAAAQYWALYAEFYRNLTEMPPDHLPHVFVETFANAYRESVDEDPVR